MKLFKRMVVSIVCVSMIFVFAVSANAGSVSGTSSATFAPGVANEINVKNMSAGSRYYKMSISNASCSSGIAMHEVTYTTSATIKEWTFTKAKGSYSKYYTLSSSADVYFAVENQSSASCYATVGWDYNAPY